MMCTIRIHALRMLRYHMGIDENIQTIDRRRRAGKEWERDKDCKEGLEGCSGRLQHHSGQTGVQEARRRAVNH